MDILNSDCEYAILDGGLATELEKAGFDLNHPLWSARLILENPEAIKDVHLSYLTAGADIITSASYQASFPGCKRMGMSDEEVEKLLRKTVEIASEAREEFLREILWTGDQVRIKPLIAASIGPYGAYLANGAEYTGDYKVSNSELFDFHARRFEILSDTDADLMLCETVPSFQEASVLREIIDQSSNGKPAFISFSCKDDEHINDGSLLRDCAAMLADCEGITAIGINCTPPRFVSNLIERIREGAPEKEILVYPNSGEIYDGESKSWKGISSEKNFTEFARDWFLKDAGIIGGCCRTGPEHIRAIREIALNQ